MSMTGLSYRDEVLCVKDINKSRFSLNPLYRDALDYNGVSCSDIMESQISYLQMIDIVSEYEDACDVNLIMMKDGLQSMSSNYIRALEKSLMRAYEVLAEISNGSMDKNTDFISMLLNGSNE